MNSRLDLVVRRPLKPISNDDLASIPTWAKAMARTVSESGLVDKAVAADMDIDASQLSKTVSGQLGIMPDKLFRLMDTCGTELALMWLNYQRGYDINAMRKRQTELEIERDRERRRAEAAEAKLATLVEFFGATRAA